MNERLESLDAELEPLERFMEFFGAEPEPRGREELDEEQKAQLSKLARGELTAEERAELIPLLNKNEAAMEFLAGEAE